MFCNQCNFKPDLNTLVNCIVVLHIKRVPQKYRSMGNYLFKYNNKCSNCLRLYDTFVYTELDFLLLVLKPSWIWNKKKKCLWVKTFWYTLLKESALIQSIPGSQSSEDYGSQWQCMLIKITSAAHEDLMMNALSDT